MPPVGHYLKELLHEAIALDSKIIRTVPALLFRPGFLTNEYLAGRRSRYLTPSRLYLLVAIVVFFFMGNMIHSRMQAGQSGKVLKVNVTSNNLKEEQAWKYGDIVMKNAAETLPYTILLASTPIFALLLKLLYWRKRTLYAAHLVFSFHFFAFAFIVMSPGAFHDSGDLAIVGFLLFFIYLYIAMRRVYGDRGFRLLLRCLSSSVSYMAFVILGFYLSIRLAIVYLSLTGQLPSGQDFRF